jgi:hypothetical protein
MEPTTTIFNADKYDSILKSIEFKLTVQSSLLKAIYDLKTTELDMQRDRDSDAKRQADLLRAETRSQNANQASVQETQTQIMPQPTEDSSIFSDIFSMALAGISALSLAGVVSKLVKGGFVLAIADSIGDFIGTLTTESIKALGASDDVSLAFGEAFNAAFSWGLLGSLFGRRFAKIFAIGAASGSLISNLFGIDDEQAVLEAFGAEFTAADFAEIGGILALAFGPSLIRRLFMSEVLTKGVGGAVLRPALAGSFQSAFRAVGWGTMIAGIGTLLGNAITAAGAPEEVGNAVSWTGMYAGAGFTIGSMFGPGGAVLGAIAGLAIGLGGALLDYLSDDEFIERAKQQLQTILDNEMLKETVLDSAAAAAPMVGATIGTNQNTQLSDYIQQDRLLNETARELTRREIDAAAATPEQIAEATAAAVQNLADEKLAVLSTMTPATIASMAGLDRLGETMTEEGAEQLRAYLNFMREQKDTSDQAAVAYNEIMAMLERAASEASPDALISEGGGYARLGNILNEYLYDKPTAVNEFGSVADQLNIQSDNALRQRVERLIQEAEIRQRELSGTPMATGAPMSVNTGGNVTNAPTVNNTNNYYGGHSIDRPAWLLN